MRNVFETLKGLFFAFRENLPHQLLTYTWEKRYGVQTCCYRLRVVEEIHESRLLLLDYHFKRVRQLHFRSMREFFIAHSPFDVINLALLLFPYIKAVIRLRNEALTRYEFEERKVALTNNCLLYTSDAADEEDSVDLGGRRIIKKKKNKKKTKQQ